VAAPFEIGGIRVRGRPDAVGFANAPLFAVCECPSLDLFFCGILVGMLTRFRAAGIAAPALDRPWAGPGLW